VIVHINHIAPSKKKTAGQSPVSQLAGLVNCTMLSMVEDGVQDIFVSDMDDYRKGFRGPGKLDGSLVTWVNGALLRAVGARAGYDVHFAPFPYRPGTRTTILYTTQRA
jgi:hypothetical protein